MKKAEREEIIQVLKDLKNYVELNLHEEVFLCTMGFYIGKRDAATYFKVCGYNDRMIPQARTYIQSQKPTARLNKEHYYAVYFKQDSTLINSPWWSYATSSDQDYESISTIGANMAKTRFLQHLIFKLH